MAEKPNLLFLYTDEQRYDTMACYGNPRIRTPNLNAFAEESFVFEHAYVSQPVCTPARSTILTGLYPHTNGCTALNIPLRPETPTLAEMVSEGYRCAHYGKWHLGDEVIPQHGFGDWLTTVDDYRPYYSKTEYLSRLSDYHHFLIENGFEPDREREGAAVFSREMSARLEEPYTKASFLGREAARFIRERRDGVPFVLFVNFLEPHMPFTGPFDDLHAPDEVLAGPHFAVRPPPNASLVHRMLAAYFMQAEYEGHDLRTEAGWRKLRARYWGLVALVDRAVGEILAALQESGLAENTIVVFTSDHGDMMGDHGILAKSMLYEESIRVPLLVRVPWLSSRSDPIQGRISQVDLVPTLLDLMGEPVPGALQGTSRAGVLSGDSRLDDNDVFVEWTGRNGRMRPGPPLTTADLETGRILELPWRTVISADGWKLNLSPEDQCELYDLNSDPCEQVNRFDDPDQGNRIRDLVGRIRQWQEETHDTHDLGR